jgi:hypothetical protein
MSPEAGACRTLPARHEARQLRPMQSMVRQRPANFKLGGAVAPQGGARTTTEMHHACRCFGGRYLAR